MNLARIIPLCMVLLLLAGCGTTKGSMPTTSFSAPNAVARAVPRPVQCVPYAREVSGIQIRGDAHTWWTRAHPRYRRGQIPQPGSVLVLARTSNMTSGHVAVVRNVINPRTINVTHSNWGNDRASRSVIYDSMRVEDISAANDWTRVRFWNQAVNNFGFPYTAHGFIYP